MPQVDIRPGGLDALARPGNPISYTLTVATAGYWAGKTWTATAGGTAMGLAVVGDVMTLTLTGADTLALGNGKHAVVLTDTTGDDTTIISGRLILTNTATGSPDQSTSVVISPTVSVDVTVAAGFGLALPSGTPGVGKVPAITSTSPLTTAWTDVGTQVELDAAIAALSGAYALLLEQGTTVGKSSIDDGELVIDISSKWGIDSDGSVYFDEAGATSGEEAVLHVDDNGAITFLSVADLTFDVEPEVDPLTQAEADLLYVDLRKHGTTLGETTIDADTLSVVVDVDTNWGVHAGVPYWDDDGPTAGEEALLHVDADGRLSWVLISDMDDPGLSEVDVEEAARIAADAAEATARAAADTAEASARAAADTTEATARAAGDAAAVQRANHTGTQTASTISDFDAQVRTSRLDQMAAPTADVSANSHKVTNVADATAATDALNRQSGDARYPRLIGEQHSDTSAANTTAETTLFTQALPTTLKAGDLLYLDLFGDLNNNTAGAVNYTWRVKIGTTAALTSPGTSVGQSASGRRKWTARVAILIESTTAQRVEGRLGVSSVSAVTWQAYSFAVEGVGSAAEDTTSAKNLTFTVQMGTADANADFFLKGAALTLIPK